MSDLTVDRAGPVVIATINREERGNSIGGSLMKDLADLAWRIEGDDEAGALVVTARGRIWCSGGDPSSLRAGFGAGADAGHLVFRDRIGGDQGIDIDSDQTLAFDAVGLGAWLDLYLRCRKPLIAAVNGAAVGGGFALALAHDIRVAAASARFIPAFAGLGVGPELGTSWHLPRLVGPTRATEILMRNTTVDAAEAHRIGLVNEVHPDEELLEHAVRTATDIAERGDETNRRTLRALRNVDNRGLEDSLRDQWAVREG